MARLLCVFKLCFQIIKLDDSKVEVWSGGVKSVYLKMLIVIIYKTWCDDRLKM